MMLNHGSPSPSPLFAAALIFLALIADALSLARSLVLEEEAVDTLIVLGTGVLLERDFSSSAFSRSSAFFFASSSARSTPRQVRAHPVFRSSICAVNTAQCVASVA
eukprot:577233-Rhodomonas_salina.3